MSQAKKTVSFQLINTLVANSKLNKIHNVLYHLYERPEEPEEEFLVENLYTSPKFKKK